MASIVVISNLEFKVAIQMAKILGKEGRVDGWNMTQRLLSNRKMWTNFPNMPSGIDSITVYQPCNTVSNVANWYAVLDVCEREDTSKWAIQDVF
jgi:hypothetical protein